MFVGAGTGLAVAFFILMICYCCYRGQKNKTRKPTAMGLNPNDTFASMQLKEFDSSPTRQIESYFPTTSTCSIHGPRPPVDFEQFQYHSLYHHDNVINNRFGFPPTDV